MIGFLLALPYAIGYRWGRQQAINAMIARSLTDAALEGALEAFAAELEARETEDTAEEEE